MSTVGLPKDVADAKRALLELKAGMSLQKGTLVSLASVDDLGTTRSTLRADNVRRHTGTSTHAAALPSKPLKPARRPKSRDEAATWIQVRQPLCATGSLTRALRRAFIAWWL